MIIDKLRSQCASAKNVLNNHGVVCFPTETVMGLAVAFDDFDAYNNLNRIKERPEDKPYTLMLGDVKDISKYAFINEKVQRIIDSFMPGSITILVPVKESVPSYVTHNTSIIGLRVPTNKEALDMLKAFGKPVLAPSANKSGQKPALNSEEAMEIFGDQIDCYIEGSAKLDKPSTIVNLCGEQPVVVREGPISLLDILNVWN